MKSIVTPSDREHCSQLVLRSVDRGTALDRQTFVVPTGGRGPGGLQNTNLFEPMDESSHALTSHVIDPRALDSTVEAAWIDMLRDKPRQTAFLGPTFARAVAASGGLARVCVIESEGQPVCFFPFQFRSAWKQALAAAEQIGGSMSDTAGIIARPTFRIDGDQLLKLAKLHSYSFSALPESQQTHHLTGGEPRIGLRIEFPMGGERYWAERRQIDAELVRDTERRRRKIQQSIGPLRFELRASDPRAALDHLVAMKRSQYARTGAEDALGPSVHRSMLHGLLTAQRPDCEGVLSTLHAGDTWVASHFGLKCGETLSYWFPVYNPELTKFSPGRLLLLEIINSASEVGLHVIDRGEGASQAKRDFATNQKVYFRGRWSRSSLRALMNSVDDSLHWRFMRLVR